MKTISTYQSFLTSIIYLLLVVQIGVTVLSYADWLTESKSTLIEFYSCEENEMKLEDNKKEKVDTYTFSMDFIIFSPSNKTQTVLKAEVFCSSHHPEIVTPPPKFSLLFS